MKNLLLLAALCSVPLLADAADPARSAADKFAQLGYLLDSPNENRLASGAPGPAYWQQRADYTIEVSLDDDTQQIKGSERIVYHNHSPHTLKYLWLQLDQNRFRQDSDDVLTKTAPGFEKLPYRAMTSLLGRAGFDGGVTLGAVTDDRGQTLQYSVIKTMMRIELPAPLAPQQSLTLHLDWQHNIIDAANIAGRGGYEYFEEDGNYIYEIAQWFPRVVSYTDYQGWQHKQFLGNGEFTLEMGNYDVTITVPSDHIVAATGELQNAEQVLSKTQRKRLAKARNSDQPVFVVTPKEAAKNQKKSAGGSKSWHFRADNVRDFAFATSRKFIWDAMGTHSGDQDVLAMSYYPNEGEPLWSQYSTQAVIHTIDIYSQYTFDYPYPVAISVNGPVGGMEYPMISFNSPRPYEDKTYWDESQKKVDKSWARSKYGLISVIIHEVGHNYFPMIVNSDERQWTWMDEGLNTFLQYLAEQAWEPNYPSRRGEPEKIVEYMVSERQVPIMTNSESIQQFGNNAYGKPATALNILRESILGREQFDYAFREYAQRWMFKRPTPGDLFRTLEDASGTDLDWFWRGWFYSTDHVEVELANVHLYQVGSRDPDTEKAWLRAEDAKGQDSLSAQRNSGQPTRVDAYPELKDFYNDFDEFAVTPYDYSIYRKLLKSLEDRETALLHSDKLFYTVDFINHGGLVTPLPLRITYADGTVEEMTIPAEIWRRNANKVTKLFMTEQEITLIELDPYRSTADAVTANNRWPREIERSRFKLFKNKKKPNYMQRMDEKKWADEDGKD